MGRLIDAYVLMADVRNTITEESGAIDWINLINRQMTAYDTDKVVERLEEVRQINASANAEAIERMCGASANYYKGAECAYERAIEIVKGECATEQSCEWKLEDLESNLYVTGCENRQLIFEGTPEENGYKYCPYCGRKIKRGGADGD